MRRHLRSALFATVVAVGALALVLGVALSAGAGPAGAARPHPTPPPPSGHVNVILFIGDGMGPNHVQVGRMLNGGSLNIDSIVWGGKGTLDTTSLDGVTDSAAAATALATGHETWNNWLSMGPGADGDQTIFETALERAETFGKATGLITDLELSDATPAAFTAHVPDRDLGLEITQEMAAHDIEFLASGNWASRRFCSNPPIPSPTSR